MLSLFAPTEAALSALLQREQGAAFTYPDPGLTRQDAPPSAGYDLDCNAIQVGSGGATFAAAVAALRKWRMFPPTWTRIVPTGALIAEGQTVVVVARVLGLWWTNTARVVYTFDEPRRAGFAYGTLPDHAERGEERFRIEWRDDDSVWYDLRAVSRPRHWLARLGYPIVRRLQRTFARDSLAALCAAVRETPG
jgi:uncharacterized protein (UPF0548 family)